MTIRQTLAVCAVAAFGGSAITADAGEKHQVYKPGEIEWTQGPASLPAGSQAAVLYGDPAKEGVFAMRLKLPEGYVIPPHTHPRPEIVTVISGTFHIGQGKTADRSQAEALDPGGFFGFAPGMAHYAHTEEETVIQLNSVGPWEIVYIDPADDPRQRTE